MNDEPKVLQAERDEAHRFAPYDDSMAADLLADHDGVHVAGSSPNSRSTS